MLSERVDSTRLDELAKKGVGLVFSLPAADFARLSACTYSTDMGQTGSGRDTDGLGELAANLQFDIGPDGFPRVGLSVTGRLSLQCQRCLKPVSWPVRIATRLSVLDSDEQMELIENPFDSVLISADGLDLATVIEDEILAALPMVPVHRDDPKCWQASGEESKSAIDVELMHRPFADLASLVGSRKGEADD